MIRHYYEPQELVYAVRAISDIPQYERGIIIGRTGMSRDKIPGRVTVRFVNAGCRSVDVADLLPVDGSPCPECGGKGRAPCEECGGTGHPGCYDCHGSGESICYPCEGYGTMKAFLDVQHEYSY